MGSSVELIQPQTINGRDGLLTADSAWGTPLNLTFVTIEEVEMETGDRGGLPVPKFRKQRSSG